MITAKDAKGDLAKIVEELKTRDATLKDVVIVLGLLLKLVIDIRGNQVAIMRKTGVELRKPRTTEDGDKKVK